MPTINPLGTSLATCTVIAWCGWLIRRKWAGPAWSAILSAVLLIAALHGPVSLSNPVVFPPWGLGWLKSAWPMLSGLAIWGWHRPRAATIAGLGTWLVLVLALRLALQGPSDLLTSTWRVVPFVSAWQSAALWHLAASAVVLAGVLALRGLWPR